MRVLAALAALAMLGCIGDEVEVELPLDLPPHFPEPQVPADNPLTQEAIELGRHLFYDERLSGPETISCSSCHQQEHAFADGERVSLGARGESGILNTPSLANAAYAHPLTWAHASLTSIEEQLRRPMFGTEPVEMDMAGAEPAILERLRGDSGYHELFGAAYPEADEPIHMDNVRLALATFVRSLVSYRSPFDAFLLGDSGAISESARRGSELFFSERLGCGGCHSGFAFTEATISVATGSQRPAGFHNIGLYNVGGSGAYPDVAPGLIGDTGIERDMGRFRVPSLRNVAVTAPYMHDGSVATLEEVVRIYEDGGRNIASGEWAGDGRRSPLRSEALRELTLSNDERADLLDFLGSLTDEAFLTDPRYRSPRAE